MRHSLIYLFLLAMTFCSCRQGTKNNNAKNFNIAELALIQTCVDSTLQLDCTLNTTKYSIDFSLVTTLNRQTIDSFLKANPLVAETNLDSLFKHDIKWIRYQYFDNPVIRFEKIIYQKNGTILINTSKTKASDGSIGIEIILKPDGPKYTCLKSIITWIS